MEEITGNTQWHPGFCSAIKLELSEITLTFVRQRFPQKLFAWLKEKGYVITEEYRGIFYVRKTEDLPVQIIVVKRLSKGSQKWLSLLKNDLDSEDAKRAVDQSNQLSTKEERNHADAVLQVAVSANKEIFDEVKKGDDLVCEALRRLMEPEIT